MKFYQDAIIQTQKQDYYINLQIDWYGGKISFAPPRPTSLDEDWATTGVWGERDIVDGPGGSGYRGSGDGRSDRGVYIRDTTG
jgi:hypothetical protein